MMNDPEYELLNSTKISDQYVDEGSNSLSKKYHSYIVFLLVGGCTIFFISAWLLWRPTDHIPESGIQKNEQNTIVSYEA